MATVNITVGRIKLEPGPMRMMEAEIELNDQQVRDAIAMLLDHADAADVVAMIGYQEAGAIIDRVLGTSPKDVEARIRSTIRAEVERLTYDRAILDTISEVPARHTT